MIISIVLSTDMAFHFSSLANFISRQNSNDFDPSKVDKVICLNMLTHLSDISNPTKSWDLCKKWT